MIVEEMLLTLPTLFALPSTGGGGPSSIPASSSRSPSIILLTASSGPEENIHLDTMDGTATDGRKEIQTMTT